METPTLSATGVIRQIVIGVAAATLPLLAGCAANFGAQTQVQYQPGVGSNDRDGDVYVINALVVADDEGNGTVVTTLINQTSDTDFVTGFQATDSDGGGLQTSRLPRLEGSEATDAPERGLELTSQTAVKVPDDSTLQLSGEAVTPGTVATLSLTFQDAAPLDIEVPVVAEGTVYDGITVGPIQSPGPSPTPETPAAS